MRQSLPYFTQLVVSKTLTTDSRNLYTVSATGRDRLLVSLIPLPCHFRLLTRRNSSSGLLGPAPDDIEERSGRSRYWSSTAQQAPDQPYRRRDHRNAQRRRKDQCRYLDPAHDDWLTAHCRQCRFERA